MKKHVLVFIALLLCGCQGFKSMKAVFVPQSPYEQYLESLEKAGLLKTAMVREWVAAGQRVFDDSIIIRAPFSESGYFPASATDARSYRFTVHEGQVLIVQSAVKAEGNARLFVDLFLKTGEQWDRLDTPDSTSSFTEEFTSEHECVLRLQPELLAKIYYTISISIMPALPNPVYGASNRSIGSFYGAPRDEGKRRHEGVDIFARKGTPVLAPADGDITRVGLTRLGGKVVWLRDSKRHHSYYFAHLDSQMVKAGMHVFQGYVLGLVGKTGNARNTAPHLHFGIYSHGAKDPLYYILISKPASHPLPDTVFQRQPFKTGRRRVPMMAGPSDTLPLRSLLAKDTYLTALGESGSWYRVLLPDRSEGYVLKRNVAPLSGGAMLTLDSAGVLLSEIKEEAIPVARLAEDTPVQVLARFKDYRFVRTKLGKAGWLCN